MTVSETSPLYSSAPVPGAPVEIADGVMWVRMPVRLAIDHVNIWLLRDGDGWTVVDTGIFSPAAVDVWETLLSGPLAGRPLRRLICTHMHPDHVGMAGWVVQRTGCDFWMTRLEYLSARSVTSDPGENFPGALSRYYRSAGFEDGLGQRVHANFQAFRDHFHPLPGSFRRIVDGESIRIGDYLWRVVVGSGHSPEHACLVCDESSLMISGDQVLEKISSNVSVMPVEPLANPLREWMDSLRRLRAGLGDELLVLPSHDLPFRGLHRRLEALLAHHESRLQRLTSRLAEPARAVDLMEFFFQRRLSESMMHLAVGELGAHLNYLEATGAIRRRSDAQGVAWFSTVASTRG